MKTMKKTGLAVAFILGSLLAYTQDTLYENADSIRLTPNNTARTIPHVARGPGQGGNLGWNAPMADSVSQKWYCMNPETKQQVKLEENGFKVKNEVILKNGILVTNGGQVLQPDSSYFQLQQGECISNNGDIER